MYNSSVNKFGHYLTCSTKPKPGPPGVGFKLNSVGDFDIARKKLTNVKNPSESNDAVTLEYLTQHVKKSCFTPESDSFDFRSQPLKNIAQPTSELDAVNEKYLKEKQYLNIPLDVDCISLDNKRLVNLEDPIDELDAVNRRTLETTAIVAIEKCLSINQESNTVDLKNSRFTNIPTVQFADDFITKNYFEKTLRPIDQELITEISVIKNLLRLQ